MFVIAFLFMVPISQAQKAGLTITLNPIINNTITTVINNNTYSGGGPVLTGGEPFLYNDSASIYFDSSYGNATYIQRSEWVNCSAGQFVNALGSCSTPSGSGNVSGAGNPSMLAVWGAGGYLGQNSTIFYSSTQTDSQITTANSSMAAYCAGIDIATNATLKNWVTGQNYLTAETNWNANYSLVYMASNPYGFYNSSNFLITDYYLKSNPYGYYNSTTIPSYYPYSNSYSYYNATTIPAYLTSESDPQVDILSAGKFCTTNGSVINCTADPPSVDLSSYYTKAQGNATYVKFSDWVNCTGGQFVNALGSCASPSGSGNITGDGEIGMIAVWRTTGYIGINSTSYYTSAQVDTLVTNTNTSMKGYVDGKFYLASNPSGYISSYTETDPYWSANYSGYNKANWDNAHLYVNNGTFYLATNPTGYITATTDTNTNTTMAAYVDGKIANENTTMKAYVDGRDTATNTSATQYAQQLDTATNNTMAAYCQGIDTITNTSLKAWVTGQNYYASSDPYGFYNSSDFLIADYYLKSNPYSYYNSTTIPGYYPYSNPYSYYNATTLPADDDTPDSDSEVPNDITIYGSQNITLTGTANITVSSAIYIGGATGWKIYVNGTGYLIAEDV